MNQPQHKLNEQQQEQPEQAGEPSKAVVTSPVTVTVTASSASVPSSNKRSMDSNDHSTITPITPTTKRQRLETEAETETSTPQQQPRSLPHPDQHARSSPDEYFQILLQAIHQRNFSSQSVSDIQQKNPDFFPPISQSQTDGYQPELVTAVRTNNFTKFQDLMMATPVNCCNRFGESILHIMCRRGYQDMFDYIIDSVALRCVDDGGRTPLHDACWHPTPQTELCLKIVQQDPTLLLIRDKRGYTPFQYARSEHWKIWKMFLFEHHGLFNKLEQSGDIFTK